ncbi:helix-turn-helix domain-containing protein [Azospirillum sp. A26]|uniref:helix-turn-helix domain-containing protein n=1 Tax=Azospirillum sp. A26 TaxID=3160607 RepID=UPI00366BA71D
MSIFLMAAAWRVRLKNAAAKAVLVRLCDFADDNGANVFPAVPTVARDCDLGERTVQEALRRLEADGLLVMVREADFSRRRPREYRIDVTVLGQMAEPHDERRTGRRTGAGTAPAQDAHRCGSHTGAESAPVQEPHPTGAAAAPNPPLDPPREKTDSPAPAVPKRTHTAPDDEPEGFADWYAAYPRKRDPGQARKAYRAALRKTSPAVLLMAARAYADDCHRTGRDPKFTKHPTTWLNAEAWTNPPELTEGGFHDGQHTRSPAQEPRGAAAVEQLLARLGEGLGDAQRGADDGPGLYRPAWDLDLSATPAPDDPPGGE